MKRKLISVNVVCQAYKRPVFVKTISRFKGMIVI